MKVYYDVEDEKSVVIQLTVDEAKAFDKFLHSGMHPKQYKPLTKAAKGYKIAQKISDLMCIW